MNKNIIKTVPDTLILEDRARAALNAVIGVADEDYNYIPFFSGFLTSDPAWMTHGNWDYGSSHGRLIDALALARVMTGSSYGEEVEMHYKKNLLSFFGKNGLSFRKNSFSKEEIEEHDSTFEDSASMIDQRAVLLSLTSWLNLTGDSKVMDYADRLCAGLKKIARKERESWYYPASEYTNHGWPSFDAVHTRLTVDPAAMWGRQVMPLIEYHKLTGNRDAYELSENFVNNIVYRSGVFNSDGSFNSALEHRNGHFHTRMGTLASILDFAMYTNDAFLINYVKRSYDWALTKCTSYGWTPGDLYDQAYEHETCSLVDSISIAIMLAKCGYPEFWGVAEKFIRNHLTEAQLMDISWIKESDSKANDIHGFKTYYKVASRLRGAFAGYSAPNDFVNNGKWGRGHIMDLQTCCIGSGTRALYTAWNNVVTESRNRVSINFLLTRSTDWLDISSFLPHEGKLVIEINKDIDELTVRIPEWVPVGAVDITRTFGGDTTVLSGRALPVVNKFFLNIGAARSGEKIVIVFPMEERTTAETAVNLEYRVKWLGDDVIHIDPEGTYYPLYNRRKIYGKAPEIKAELTRGTGKIN